MRFRLPFRVLLMTLVGLCASLASVFAQADPPSATPPPHRIAINLAARTLSILQGERLLRTFPVGVGRLNFPTPTGEFQVIRKVVNPAWENPYAGVQKMVIKAGSANPLGTRWIGFHRDAKGEFGIHGTNNPASVGKYSSHGCIRMRIPDAEAVFAAIDLGSPVSIAYDPAVIQRDGILLTLRVYPDALQRGMPNADAIQERVRRQYPDAQTNPLLIAYALRRPSLPPTIIGFIASREADKPKAASVQDAHKF
ncbi:MAG: L,D-transpeptidase [Vampirovibrionales bacterium]|nr:L,D-transpeptidase [Vampirovibrionales bacterium]